MSRKELLDARKALRSVREGVSGPRSKKQRGEWELATVQEMCYDHMNCFVVDPYAGWMYRMMQYESMVTL